MTPTPAPLNFDNLDAPHFDTCESPSATKILLRAGTPPTAERSAATTGILVHGCHLEADGWEAIVWGDPARNLLGRLPHAALLAWEERHSLRRVVCGTGASQAADGRTEAEVTIDLLWSRFDRLAEFDAFRSVDLAALCRLLRAVVRAETRSQNTAEEVTSALGAFRSEGVRKAILVSSPTHLPRCLACAGRVAEENPGLYDGAVWASPSGTGYQNSQAADLVVVEPPHRGDRDRTLDALPQLHALVRRSFAIGAPQDRARFLVRLDALLSEFGA